MSSSVSGDANTETCGEKARKIKSRVSLVATGPGIDGEGDLTVEDRGGVYTEPLRGAVEGVPAREPPLGDPGFARVGSEEVDAKRFEREAFERRYGRAVAIAERADLPWRLLSTVMPASESESSGSSDGGMSGLGVVWRAGDAGP
jgi:hypothetical protein